MRVGLLAFYVIAFHKKVIIYRNKLLLKSFLDKKLFIFTTMTPFPHHTTFSVYILAWHDISWSMVGGVLVEGRVGGVLTEGRVGGLVRGRKIYILGAYKYSFYHMIYFLWIRNYTIYIKERYILLILTLKQDFKYIKKKYKSFFYNFCSLFLFISINSKRKHFNKYRFYNNKNISN